MPITFHWYDASKTIMVLKFPDHWTWEEYQAACSACGREIRTQSHPVATITDCSEMKHVPVEIIMRVKETLDAAPPNIQLQIIIGANRLLRALYVSFSRIFGDHNLLFIPTLQDAVVHIHASSPPPTVASCGTK